MLNPHWNCAGTIQWVLNAIQWVLNGTKWKKKSFNLIKSKMKTTKSLSSAILSGKSHLKYPDFFFVVANVTDCNDLSFPSILTVSILWQSAQHEQWINMNSSFECAFFSCWTHSYYLRAELCFFSYFFSFHSTCFPSVDDGKQHKIAISLNCWIGRCRLMSKPAGAGSCQNMYVRWELNSI